MPREPKAVTDYGRLNAIDQRLASKLIRTLGEGTMQTADRTAIKRALIRSRRGPNSSGSPRAKYSNAYTVFYSEMFPAAWAEHKGLGITGVAKLLGSRWRGLTDEERDVYKQQAKTARTRSIGPTSAATED